MAIRWTETQEDLAPIVQWRIGEWARRTVGDVPEAEQPQDPQQRDLWVPVVSVEHSGRRGLARHVINDVLRPEDSAIGEALRNIPRWNGKLGEFAIMVFEGDTWADYNHDLHQVAPLSASETLDDDTDLRVMGERFWRGPAELQIARRSLRHH